MTKKLNICFFVVLFWLFCALLGILNPFHENQIVLNKILQEPSWNNWCGYDHLGRSICERIILGAKTSFSVAIIVVLISFIVGTTLGVIGAWFGGIYDKVLVILIDIFIAFPGILLAIALAGLLGPGLINTVIALSIVGWVGFSRLARVQTLSIKNRDHIAAAQALGTMDYRITLKHVLPLIMAPLIIEATFSVAGVIIAEAGLSFLGLGIQPPIASWGSMIKDGSQYMLVAPHAVLIPSFAILSLVLCINFLGDHIRDMLDITESK